MDMDRLRCPQTRGGCGDLHRGHPSPHAARFLLAGHQRGCNTFARTPDVTYVFAHAGGTVPYLAGRFAIIDQMRVIPGAEARATAAETFRRLYWDTALSWGDPVLRMLREVVGIDHVLFGSDYPYLRRDLAVSCREHIEASPELTGSERSAILGGPATKLIPRLASRLPRPLPHPS